MAQLFAVIRSRGSAWNDALPMEAQADWPSHASFMDALHEEGFAVLVGPLEETRNVLLIVRAEDAAEVRSRLSGDPWSRNGLLRIDRVAAWTLRLGSLGPEAD